MKKIVCAVVLLTASVLGFAQQNLRSAYFLEGYTYRYRFNPAFYSQQGFAMAGIGNASVGIESNLALNTFLNPDSNGNLRSFMSDAVTNDMFMKYVKTNNKATVDISTTLASASFWTGKFFHSIEWNMRAYAHGQAPRELFSMMKNTDPTACYSIPQMSANLNAYTEVAYGLATDINENIHIGGRAKFLIGFVNANLTAKDLTINSDGDGGYMMSGATEAMFFLPFGASIPTRGELAGEDGVPCDPKLANRLKFSKIQQPSSLGEGLKYPRGFGMAIDFGMSFDFADYFTAAFSILDLGFMQWDCGEGAQFDPLLPWHFQGMTTFPENCEIGYKDQYDTIGSDIEDAFPFERDEAYPEMRQLEMLQFSANASLEYRMPFYDKLSVGALFSAHAKIHPMPGVSKRCIQMADMNDFCWFEGRLVASVAPLDWLSCSLDYAYNNFGHSFGTALNIHCPYFNFFIGTDNLVPVFTFKKNIPGHRMNSTASFGINVLFGERH